MHRVTLSVSLQILCFRLHQLCKAGSLCNESRDSPITTRESSMHKRQWRHKCNKVTQEVTVEG